jgi:hypothetical protein
MCTLKVFLGGRNTLSLNILCLTLKSLLRVEEVLGGGLAFHPTFLKDFVIKRRFLAKKFDGLTNQLPAFVSFAGFRWNRDKVSLFLTMTGR